MSDWQKFKDNMKKKRGNRGEQKKDNSVKTKIIESECIVVQRLSQEVSGKAQKYSRIGAREFVPFKCEQITIENIKSSCLQHFLVDGTGMLCDVLAGEQGPSCKDVKQIPDLKVIYVRFIDIPNSQITSSSLDLGLVNRAHNPFSEPTTEAQSSRKRKRPEPITGIELTAGRSQSHNHKDSDRSKCIPKSLSVLDMLKLGKTIQDTKTVVEIMIFDIDGMTWCAPHNVEFVIEKNMFASGGFREAYKAKSEHTDFKNKIWVVKKYLQNSLDIINATEQSTEQHTRKIVQTHMLVRNMAAKLDQEIQEKSIQEYGETFHYKQIYLGHIKSTNEMITVEEYISGQFKKYVNNDGQCLNFNDDMPICQKAESFMHHSYERSNCELLVVDIQGCEYCLCDPEIASKSLVDDNEYLFTTGNLSSAAIENFRESHECNKYCGMLNLTAIDKLPINLGSSDEN